MDLGRENQKRVYLPGFCLVVVTFLRQKNGSELVKIINSFSGMLCSKYLDIISHGRNMWAACGKESQVKQRSRQYPCHGGQRYILQGMENH